MALRMCQRSAKALQMASAAKLTAFTKAGDDEFSADQTAPTMPVTPSAHTAASP